MCDETLVGLNEINRGTASYDTELMYNPVGTYRVAVPDENFLKSACIKLKFLTIHILNFILLPF